MYIHRTPNFTLYFGDASDMIYPQDYLNRPADIFFARTTAIRTLKNKLAIDTLFFAHQIHSAHGLHVTDTVCSTMSSFHYQADFLYTTRPRTGIGVMTADCLPIAIYDPIQKVAAIVHAGWRGSVEQIATTALQSMHESFGTKMADVKVFFGPHAKMCCYEIQSDLLDTLTQYPEYDQSLETRAGTHFFDLARFNYNQLIRAGVKPSALSYIYAPCTICTIQFCSYRRDADKAGRQMTIITLI